jgi:hypothetical protein
LATYLLVQALLFCLIVGELAWANALSAWVDVAPGVSAQDARGG